MNDLPLTYDYVIVGAGSAGCILAARLSESGRHSVLLLEAGGADDGFWFKLPAGFVKLYYNPACNWMYRSEPQPRLGGRSLYAPRGKVRGGSGAINAMIFVRGHAQDFDDWEAAGNPGWSFRDVLPYFRKLETHPAGSSEVHGGDGPIHITPMRGRTHPLCDHFLAGCDELGYPLNEDFNGARLEGAGIYDVNTRDGQRCSSSAAYLAPATNRRNLRVELHARAERIVFGAGNRAIGVSVEQNGLQRTFLAAREVILAAGAVDTPKLLQLSGVADHGLLQRHGIQTVHHLPAVGRGLQDHLCASYYYKAKVPTLNDELGTWRGKARAGLRYLLSRTGPLSVSVNQAGGFFRGDDRQERPNLQLYFNPLSYQIPKHGTTIRPEPYSGFLLCFNACRPTSRGTVEIASPRMTDAPRIDPNYLHTEHDVREAIQGGHLIRRIMDAPALRAITQDEILPGAAIAGDDAMLDYFRQNSGSIYHLCGSCTMGPDPGRAVVDASLRVHGLEGLRIADASVFPNVTSGNTNAATMMVAEKAAELILRDAR